MLRLSQSLVFCGFVVCLPVGCTGVVGESVQTVASTPDKELLTRFVNECVTIEPGKEPFPGQFQIGSQDEGEAALPPAIVEMRTKFRISKFEVTQDLYESVMGNNPSRWKGLRNSVETLNFSAAKQFCVKLTAALHATGLIAPSEIVRLPTEAEWEYCCRAGTATKYSFGDSATAAEDKENQATVLNDYAWHTGNAAGNDPSVGSLKPNPWQLYDMHGYLWEFVSEAQPKTDPLEARKERAPRSDDSPLSETRCVIRGGSWQDHHAMLSSASRRTIRDSRTSDAIGFRCVIAEQPQGK